MSNGEPSKSYDFGSELDEVAQEDWTPHPQSNDVQPKPDLDQVREIAEKEGFTSREPKAAVPDKEPSDQVSIRGRKSVIDGFKAFCKAQEPEWPQGYALERAMQALKRELGQE